MEHYTGVAVGHEANRRGKRKKQNKYRRHRRADTFCGVFFFACRIKPNPPPLFNPIRVSPLADGGDLLTKQFSALPVIAGANRGGR